jgi:hypothetical protein
MPRIHDHIDFTVKVFCVHRALARACNENVVAGGRELPEMRR